jgi:hypothetical protein
MMAGAALLGDPKFPYSPVYTILGGAVLGTLAGFIVWVSALRRSPSMERDRDLPHPMKSIVVSRWIGLGLLTAGLACLGVNHALVVLGHEKWFELVVGGAFLLGIGLIGILAPNALVAGMTGERLPIWVHVMSGVLAIGGLGLGFYLWIVVYK